jgi:LuxR family maltose regulon positive regulatory protein
LWAQPLNLIDGLIALATTVADLGDRSRAAEHSAEAEALVAACADAGALPARLAAAKRAARLTRAAGGGELSERVPGLRA